MANSFVNTQKVANAFLLLLKNELVMGKLVNTKFDKDFSSEQIAVGDTVKVRRPPEYTVRDGADAEVQDSKTGSVDITIDKQKGVDLQFTSKELTLEVDELLKNQNMKSQASALAQQIDADIVAETLKFPHWVGTPGETIDSAKDFFVGPQRMDELSIPNNDRFGILSPADYWGLAGSLTGLNSDSTVKTALEKAKLPLLGNVQAYMSQNVINLVTGTRVSSSAGQVDGASQNVAYETVRTTYVQDLKLKGLASGATIKAGEVFTIAGVNAVNPANKADLGYLQMFVVQADKEVGVDGKVTVSIANPIITTGAYQNVTSAPANSAPVTFIGDPSTAYRQNSIFHRSSIALVGAKLVAPESGNYSFATDKETGLSVRFWRISDGVHDTHLSRCDVLYGVKNIDPRLGIRISGQAELDITS